MKENPGNDARGGRRSTWKPLVAAAGIVAVVQACLTVEGMGIEGFVLWILILFAGYLLLFSFLRWLWGRFKQ